MKQRDFGPSVRRLLISWAVGQSRMGRPRRLLRVWPLWERVARTLWTVVPVPGSPYGMLGLHFTHYRGSSFTLPDGTEIQRGDPIAELHFNNMAFVRALQERRGSDKFLVVRLFRDEMRAVSAWMERPDVPSEVKALNGATILGRGAVRVGFTVRRRRPSLLMRFDRMFLEGLMALYTAEGLDRLLIGGTASDAMTEVWMSVAELRRRYGRTSFR